MADPDLCLDRDLVRSRAREILALREEARLRRTMPASQGIRQNLDRGPRSRRPAPTDGARPACPLSDRLWQARTMENTLAAEARARRFQPDQAPALTTTSAVPDSAAPPQPSPAADSPSRGAST